MRSFVFIGLLYMAFTFGFAVLAKATESSRCQKIVLRDLKANAAYTEELRSTVGSQDFLTEMTRGQK